MRKKYFKEIDLSKLKNERAIQFLFEANVIPTKSKMLIKDYFKKKEGDCIIQVIDHEDFLLDKNAKFDELQNNPMNQG